METAPHPWIAPARNDSGTGELRPGVKTTRKAALGACRTTPGGGTRGCPKRGPGGPRAAEKPLRSRGDPRCSAVIRRAVCGVRAASQKHWGDIEGGRGVPPRFSLEEKDAFLCCLPSVLKMSSESLGGRRDRAQLSSTVTTIFFVWRNMIDSGEGFFFINFFFLS